MSNTQVESGSHHGGSRPDEYVNGMALIALGVVFGDIGTSPLYAFQVTLAATGHKVPTALDALGIASLIIWSLLGAILVKYVMLVLRADNEGQGGILALTGLINPARWSAGTGMGVLGLLGIIGAALLYGDGVITPAISVLSAMEGLKVLAPSLELFVIPLTIGVLVGLFMIQKKGTASIGSYFGPIMLGWFVALAFIGAWNIQGNFQVLAALNPMYAFAMMKENLGAFVAIFGAVFLAITGGEALYADMGHVGAPAIRRAFLFVVLPSLILNYLGQASLIMLHPESADNPFYHSVPTLLLVPMILLAAAATIIASQALITGVYSLTRQAGQMNVLPRRRIVQTHKDEEGQIYVPDVNWKLLIGTVLVVLLFKSSEHLAAAYGIAVSGTMLITTILLFRVMRDRWGWSLFNASVVIGFFATIDAGFFAANSFKLLEGGWLPLGIAAVMTFMMTSWRAGTWAVRREIGDRSQPVSRFIEGLARGKIQVVRVEGTHEQPVVRVKGCAVWLTKITDGISPMLQHFIECNGALHERVVLMTVQTAATPFVRSSDPDRVVHVDLGQGIHQIVYRVGFMQTAKIDGALGALPGHPHAHEVHYFIANETVLRKKEGSSLGYLTFLTYSLLKRGAAKTTDFFHLRDRKVMEIGLRLEI